MCVQFVPARYNLFMNGTICSRTVQFVHERYNLFPHHTICSRTVQFVPALCNLFPHSTFPHGTICSHTVQFVPAQYIPARYNLFPHADNCHLPEWTKVHQWWKKNICQKHRFRCFAQLIFNKDKKCHIQFHKSNEQETISQSCTKIDGGML